MPPAEPNVVKPPGPDPRARRRKLRRALVASALLGLGAGFGLLVAHTDFVPAPNPAERLSGERAQDRRWTDPGEPAQELAAVLDVLFKDAPAPAAPEAPVPSAPPAPGPTRDLGNPEHARAIQNRLAELGYLPPNPVGTWGPDQFEALRMFRQVRGLGSDAVWDEATEAALFGPRAEEADTFVGRWAPDVAACAPRNRTRLIPAIINQQGAWAGDVFCSFANARREGAAWNFAASCSTGRRRWTSNVRIEVKGDVLTWTSERGSQTYHRCPTR